MPLLADYGGASNNSGSESRICTWSPRHANPTIVKMPSWQPSQL